MTNPTFRALCAELLQECQYLHDNNRRNKALWNRAHAAVMAEPVEPTDEELYELWNSEGNEADFQDCRRYARAVLARWGTPTNTINQED